MNKNNIHDFSDVLMKLIKINVMLYCKYYYKHKKTSIKAKQKQK